MTIEDLMKLRWKAIADYPHSGHNVGGIIHIDSLPLPRTGAEFFNKYPHLFKPLQWWEEREEKDMPEYVKGSGGKPYKVNEYAKYDPEIAYIKGDNNKNKRIKLRNFNPATEQDYITYQSNQKL